MLNPHYYAHVPACAFDRLLISQERYVYCAKCFVLKAKTEDVSAYKKFFPPSAPNLLSSGPNCSDKLTVGQGRVISGNEAVSRNFGKPLPANLQRLGIDLTKIAAEVRTY